MISYEFIKRSVCGVSTMVICGQDKHFLHDIQCTSDMSVKNNMSNVTGPTSLITVGPYAILLLEQN